MFDIPLLMNIFISLIEIKNIRSKNPIKERNPLFCNLFIYSIELEHPLKTSNKGTQV